MKRFSETISILFHPIFAPLLSVFILFQLPLYINYKYNSTYFIYIYSLLFINLVAAPLLISFYLKKKQVISSLQMHKVQERSIPYLITTLFFCFTYFLLRKIQFPLLYLEIFKAATLSIIILLFLAVGRQKVSAHLTGLGGICGMLFILPFFSRLDTTPLLCLFILISGLVAGSRMYLKAHSLFQVLAGFLLGFGLQLLILI
jgi:membrane-associated phospholipid phosphatase